MTTLIYLVFKSKWEEKNTKMGKWTEIQAGISEQQNYNWKEICIWKRIDSNQRNTICND